MSSLRPCLSCPQGEGTADTQSGAATGPRGSQGSGRSLGHQPLQPLTFQRTQEVQGEEQGETLCVLGKRAAQALRGSGVFWSSRL